MACICHVFFFFVLPRAYIQWGFIPSVVLRLPNNLSSSFSSRKLAVASLLTVMLGVEIGAILSHLAGIWRVLRYPGMCGSLSVCPLVGMCICISVRTSVHCQYVCMSIKYVCMVVHPSVCSLGHLGGHLSVSRNPSICQYSHLSNSPAVVSLQLWIYRYSVGCSFLQFSYCCWVQRTCPSTHMINNISKGGTQGCQLTLITVCTIFSHNGSYHSCFSL